MLITRKIIKPQNCIFSIGIPTTIEEFKKHKNVGYAYQYIQKYGNNAIKKYQSDMLDVINSIESQLFDTGLQIINGISFSKLNEIFNSETYNVIILFTHCEKNENKEEYIELNDGLVDSPTFLSIIPKSFSGIIDFTACNLSLTAMKLKANWKNCVTAYNTRDVKSPSFWLYFYLTLFKVLHYHNFSYLDAYNITIDQFCKQGRRRAINEKIKNVFSQLFI